MKAMQINPSSQGPKLIAAEIPKPQPQRDEVLIRVFADGVTPTELLWYPTTHLKDGSARTGAVPGHEFSGVIAALGENNTDFHVGDEVYGMNDWFVDGATAEYCITTPQSIAPKPATLSHAAAAATPIGALTAWQGLLVRARIQPGERVLVHGGAGAVGLFAIQLARLHGAHVITTVSERHRDLVKQLGAEEAIDYKTTPFEKVVKDIDVVFDAVGGDTLERSWSVLKPGGRMVTIAADSEATVDQRVKDAFFIVEPNHELLVEVQRLLDDGRLKAFIKATVPLDDAAAAYAGTYKSDRGFGKVVISISA